ncbi:hypothetical protein Pfo_031330 [Paulownia fortunei]|nr:hypothetical protein Pfo_031330 [Paulownia fortunei]
MKDKVLGDQTASSGDEGFNKYPKVLKQYVKNNSVVGYDTFDKAFNDLNAGRIDGLLIDEDYARYYVAHQANPNDYTVTVGNFPTDHTGVGFRKSDKALRKAVDKELAILRKMVVYKTGSRISSKKIFRLRTQEQRGLEQIAINQRHQLADIETLLPIPESASELLGLFLTSDKSVLTRGNKITTFTNGESKSMIQIVSSGPDNDMKQIKQGFMRMFASARKKIMIQTPYFIPDSPVLETLEIAILSGVEVCLMIPSMPDHPLVYRATQYYAKELIDLGATVYRYDGGFLHSKVVMIDNEVATVGSANMDIRSFSLNFEANAFIYDPNLRGTVPNRCLPLCQTHHVRVTLQLPAPDYIDDGNDLLVDAFNFLQEMIFDPLLDGQKFDRKVFVKEQQSLINELESIKDDKPRYAISQLRNITYDVPNLQSSSAGDIDLVKNLTSESLYTAYQNMISNDLVNIVVLGNVNESDVESIIKDWSISPRRLPVLQPFYRQALRPATV